VDNKLETNPVREQRVRERAYHLWEADGKPHGRDVEYWQSARELVAMEDSPGSGLLPNPETDPESVRETGAEEAEIRENLGEFSERFAAQDEEQPAPAARRSPSRRRKAPASSVKKRKTP